ncbi:MAG: amidohydrolase family protein [Bacteroidales bacterium]|nr:amidohydrolase family protein [Bacteroidales bacterium]
MILLENIQYIDDQTFAITRGDLLVEEGLNQGIRFLNKEEISKLPNACTRIPSCGKFAIKSFVNAHHHAYSALAPGMPQPKEAPKNFLEILQKIWWKLDKALTKELIEISAAATAISSAKNGVSFVIDHHASPYSVTDSLKVMAKQFDTIGLNHLLCYEISDRDGVEIRDKGLEETDAYLKYNQGLVGLHAAFTLSDDSLRKAQILAEKHNSGIHIHVAEDAYDEDYNIKKYGKRVVNRLSDFGLLDFEKSILAHCIHIDEQERALIANSKAWVVQNPESNLNNQVGFFNSDRLQTKSMLGTDGMHSNMMRSAQSSFFAGMGKDAIDIPTAYTRLRNAHRYLQSNGFKGDGENNLSIFNYNAATPLTPSNFLGHFFYAFENNHIESLIVNGKLVMRDKIILSVDEDIIMKEARKLAQKLWDKLI